MSEVTAEIKKEFAELATKLNELMKQDTVADTGEKLVPYLGWWWREIDPKYPTFKLSWCQGQWWIDEAGKWPYPSKMIRDQEAIDLLKMCITVAEKGPEGIDAPEYEALMEELKKEAEE